jgi:hypothetical protein
MSNDRDIASAYGAAMAANAAFLAFPVRPAASKSAAGSFQKFHQLGPRSWVCLIERNGRMISGRGKTKNAALLNALLTQ